MTKVPAMTLTDHSRSGVHMRHGELYSLVFGGNDHSNSTQTAPVHSLLGLVLQHMYDTLLHNTKLPTVTTMHLSSEDMFSSSLIWRFQSYFGVEKVQCLDRGKDNKWKTIKLEQNEKIEDVPPDENIIYYKVRSI